MSNSDTTVHWTFPHLLNPSCSNIFKSSDPSNYILITCHAILIQQTCLASKLFYCCLQASVSARSRQELAEQASQLQAALTAANAAPEAKAAAAAQAHQQQLDALFADRKATEDSVKVTCLTNLHACIHGQHWRSVS